jgi:glycosyltransferase involved in cell wall biosynthesis
MSEKSPRIGILVVAYNAASTLATVLDRIPTSFRSRIDEILVCDDYSQDSTYLVGLGYKQMSDLPLTIVRHPQNLGYGGNQKAGYRLAIEHGLDILVLLHGDGQYAPECIESLVDPLVRREADAVFGSRMMVRGSARKGGMPLYKYVGNRILTTFQNGMLGTDLSEFHSGYRAYSVSALASVPFERNSDGFNFDTQIILQFVDAGRRILEVPIPTYYGDEICYVNGIKYAKDVTVDVLRYRLNKMGFGAGNQDETVSEYQLKESDGSSHGQIISVMAAFPPSRVLDLGCSGGRLGERLRRQGHQVAGVETNLVAGAVERLDTLVVADLEQGIPPEAGTGYDVVVAGDVLEHLRDPEGILREMHPSRAARRICGGHGAQLRALVRTRPGGPGALRLRRARHPRSGSSPILHPAELPETRPWVTLVDLTHRVRRPSARRACQRGFNRCGRTRPVDRRSSGQDSPDIVRVSIPVPVASDGRRARS